MKTKTELMTELIVKADAKNLKVVFGLEAQGHIQTIQAELRRWNESFKEQFPNEDPIDMSYSKHVWDSIGKIIGWCPFTAALSYFEWLNEQHLRAELAEVKDGTGMGAEDIERILITLANAAYHWGCAKGEGRSEKNFNDFLGTSNYENAINKFASQSPKMQTEEVKKIIDETTEAHPYRQRGKPETYTDYNQGWEDACDILGNRIMELLTP